MKNVLFSFSLITLCTLGLNSSLVACTSFNLNYTFTTATVGQTVTVTWTSTGCAAGSMIDISLIDIAANAIVQYYPGNANSGSFNVALGSGLTPGDYRFYIQYAPAWPPEAWDYGSDFTISAALPVELTTFEANPKNNAMELIWQTASETDNEGFQVEHSVDGWDWKVLDFVEGNNNSFQTHDYSYTHQSPSSKMNFYRLKQMDFSGSFEYSKVISVRGVETGDSDIRVFPNPTSDLISLQNFEGESVSYLIYDSRGNVSQTGFSGTDLIDIQNLQLGLYYLKVIDDKNKIYRGKFLKQ